MCCDTAETLLHHLLTDHIYDCPPSSSNQHNSHNQSNNLIQALSSTTPDSMSPVTTTRTKRIIKNERKYGCKFCDKMFTRPADVRRHERIHSGERPYACSSCDNAFKTRSQLNQHALRHGDNPPKEYQCEICTNSYLTRGSLNIHLRTHTNDNPYICTFVGCDKTFHTNQMLQRHFKNEHTPAKPIDTEGILNTMKQLPDKNQQSQIYISNNTAFQNHLPHQITYETTLHYGDGTILESEPSTINCNELPITYEHVINHDSLAVNHMPMYQTLEPVYQDLVPHYSHSVYHLENIEDPWEYGYPKTN
uniref:Zinc finger protein n=1 Tax=Rhabditophanes sp. KR3021 TaxID=114890 RepID=A0AC35U804_9BILA